MFFLRVSSRSVVKQEDKKIYHVMSLAELALRRHQMLSTAELDSFDDLSLNKHFNVLQSFFGTVPSPITTCPIVSCNVFPRGQFPYVAIKICAISQSLSAGVTARYHAIFEMEQLTSPDKHVPVKRLKGLHSQLHPRSGGGHSVLVFAEDCEYEQARRILTLCKIRSYEAQLGLDWTVRCIPLGALCLYFQYLFKQPGLNFDMSIFDYHSAAMSLPVHVCRKHVCLQVADCAMAKSILYGTVLMNKFGGQFKNLFQIIEEVEEEEEKDEL